MTLVRAVAVVSLLWGFAVAFPRPPPALVDLRFDGSLTGNGGALTSSTTISPSASASLTTDRFGRASRALRLAAGNSVRSNALPLPSGNAPRSLCTWFRSTNGAGGGSPFQSIGEWGAFVSGQRFGILVSSTGYLYIVGQSLDFSCSGVAGRE